MNHARCVIIQCMFTSGCFFSFGMCGHERTCTPETYRRPPHPGGLCGNTWDNYIRDVCPLLHDFFNRISPQDEDLTIFKKSSGMSPMFPANERTFKNTYVPTKALEFLRPGRSDYYSHGSVCECCFNSCSTNEIYEYCPRNTSYPERFLR